jgi:DNA-binding LacI/PurR family transcriptional regulator
LGVTIHQVAAEAGVSPSTVSNVLNGRSERMLPQTRERVEQAIARLGYRPNGPARQLRTGRSQVVGLVVPSVANPFWGTFARHLEAAALQAGYRVLLCNSEREPERERDYLEELWADGVRGVVLCSSLPSLDHVLPLVERGLALVAFDRTAQAGDPPSLVNISVDNAVGVELATRHLLQLGHRRLAFISGSLRSVNRRARFRGFEAALDEYGLAVDDALVWSGGAEDHYGDLDFPELGRAAARELLAGRRPPTAIVAINDMCALGVSASARDAGMRVGTDLSVVGFDDIVLADLATPPLTTVRQPLPAMADAAFAHLRSAVERSGNGSGPAAAPGASLMMRPELIIRSSTGPAPAAP